MIPIQVKQIHAKAQLPQYMSVGASGSDVCACLEAPLIVSPLERVAVPTGLCFEIPEGFEIQVRPRSGLALKKGLTVVNAPGTIDSDYRGELKVLLINLGNEEVEIEPGMRVAQLVVQKVERAEWLVSADLSSTKRASGGFGSTGLHKTNESSLNQEPSH